MKGHRLLAEVNIIRAAVGRQPLGEVSMRGCSWNCATCAIEAAAGCRLRPAITEPGRREMALEFLDADTTARVGAALKRPYIENAREVRAGDPIDSFVIAAAFGLVFVDWRMTLTGWIEPTDRDPSTWDLFLLPGKLYPPGHAPLTYVDPISSCHDGFGLQREPRFARSSCPCPGCCRASLRARTQPSGAVMKPQPTRPQFWIHEQPSIVTALAAASTLLLRERGALKQQPQSRRRSGDRAPPCRR